MPTDPEQLEALLADYVDGQLSPDATREVEQYLAGRPGVRAVVAGMIADAAQLRALPKLAAPADLTEDFRGQLERDLLLNDSPIGVTHFRRLSPPAAAIAAMLVVGLGLGSVAYFLLSSRPQPFGGGDYALRTEPSTPVVARAAMQDGEATEERAARSVTRVARERTDAAGWAAAADPAGVADVSPADEATSPAPSAEQRQMASAPVTDAGAAKAASETAAPWLTLDAPQSLDVGRSLRFSDGPLPSDAKAAVEAFAPVADRSRRAVVFVVDADDAVAAEVRIGEIVGEDVRQAAESRADATLPAGGQVASRDAQRSSAAASDPAATVGGMADEGAIRGNTAATSPVADAIGAAGDNAFQQSTLSGEAAATSAAGAGRVVSVRRGLTEVDAATLLAELQVASAGPIGAAQYQAFPSQFARHEVAAYELPAAESPEAQTPPSFDDGVTPSVATTLPTFEVTSSPSATTSPTTRPTTMDVVATLEVEKDAGALIDVYVLVRPSPRAQTTTAPATTRATQ